MIWLIPIYALPSIVEAWLDRLGETTHGKRKDLLWFGIVAVLLSLGAWILLSVSPLKSIALLVGWRVLIFDYLSTWLLRKNGVIRKDANIFSYTGKTAKWDKLISRINPYVRFAIRLIIFHLAVYVWIK